MSDDLKENVMNTNIWLRLVYMLVFAVVFGASRLVLVVVIALQFLWVLFSGKRNPQLLNFGSQMATFIYQIYRFLTFNTEKKPFPFDEFPSADALIDDAVPEDEATTEDGGDDEAATTDAPVVTAAAEQAAEADTTADEAKPETAAKKPTRRRKPAAKEAEEASADEKGEEANKDKSSDTNENGADKKA